MSASCSDTMAKKVKTWIAGGGLTIYIYRSRQKGKLKPPGTPLGHLRVSILAWRKIARPVDVTTGVPLHFGGLVVARCLGLSFSLSFPFSLDQYLYLWLYIHPIGLDNTPKANQTPQRFGQHPEGQTNFPKVWTTSRRPNKLPEG